MKRKILVAALMLLAFMANGQTATDEKVLYIIDGQVASKESLDSLPPEQIKNMDVVSGIDKAVVVTTNKVDNVKVISIAGKTKGKLEQVNVSVDKPEDGSVVIDKRLDGTTMRVVRLGKDDNSNAIKALVVVKNADGTITVDQSNGESFSPQQIKTISVLKDEEAAEMFSKYGDTSNGVVLIELK